MGHLTNKILFHKSLEPCQLLIPNRCHASDNAKEKQKKPHLINAHHTNTQKECCHFFTIIKVRVKVTKKNTSKGNGAHIFHIMIGLNNDAHSHTTKVNVSSSCFDYINILLFCPYIRIFGRLMF